MFAMQYSIALPADYDMAIIRRRVAERGHLLDDFAGLGIKAYLIQERGAGRAANNSYAPFYLWPQVQSLLPFVAGPGFQGIIDSFSRVAIRSWIGLDIDISPDFAGPRIVAATRQILPIAPGADLAALRRSEAARQAELVEGGNGPALHATVLDMERWQLARFALWTENRDPGAAEPHAPVDRFQVLHVSAPHLAALKGSTAPY